MLNNYKNSTPTDSEKTLFTPGLKPLGQANPTSVNCSLVINMSSPRVIVLCIASAVSMPVGTKLTDSATQNESSSNIVYLVDEKQEFIPDTKEQVNVAIPFKEHASLVSTALGLGKSDVARILGVSRPTLYSWISGASEPKENDHPERLRLLAELTREICCDTSRPLYHRYVEEPLQGEAASILSLLKAEKWDNEKLRHLLATARQLTSERDNYLGLPTTTIGSKDQQEANLLDNSIANNVG